jgi:NAD(P)-dependent dehydrogenase (short-subunit alcohol dehydrogenase family)
MSLNGKYALITGSSRGIGRGIALKLAENGANVAVHYYQNEAAANDTLAKVREKGSAGFTVQADVSRPEEIKLIFDRVRAEFGKLDIFVSNARPEAPAFFQAPLDITLGQWDTAFDSQTKAFLVGVREALPLMTDGGRIFAITYAQGSRTGGLQPWVAMGSAKAALESLVRNFAVAVAKRGHHSECNQPRLDRGQRHEHVAGTSSAVNPKLAWARLDADGQARDPGRCWKCGFPFLLGKSGLDHRSGDLCRRWRVFDESGSSN